MDLTSTQRKLAEQLLLSVINREPVVEYSEIGARVDPPVFQRQVGREIGEVSKLCYELGLPLISAKVIPKGGDKASYGFFPLYQKLGIDTEGLTEKELFSRELKKIRECADWHILADYLGLELDFEPLYEKLGKRPKPEASSPVKWLIPSNNNKYNLIDAFGNLDKVYRRHTAIFLRVKVILDFSPVRLWEWFRKE